MFNSTSVCYIQISPVYSTSVCYIQISPVYSTSVCYIQISPCFILFYPALLHKCLLYTDITLFYSTSVCYILTSHSVSVIYLTYLTTIYLYLISPNFNCLYEVLLYTSCVYGEIISKHNCQAHSPLSTLVCELESYGLVLPFMGGSIINGLLYVYVLALFALYHTKKLSIALGDITQASVEIT